MRVVGLVKQKGGVGASTITVHLAAAAAERGFRPVIVDTDPQQSAYTWGVARGNEDPPVVSVEVAQLRAVIQAAAGDGYNLVLIDTPPHSSAVTTAVVRASDLSLIPAKPGAFDMAAIPSIARIIQATARPAVFVLNECEPRDADVDEAREILAGFGIPVWDGQISRRRAFRKILKTGRAVTESQPTSQAAEEIRALWDHLDAMMAGVGS